MSVTKISMLRVLFCTGLLLSCALCFLLFNVSAASGTVYESENNNSYLNADTISDDYDGYGLINYPSDIDYWKITFPYSGTANFYLGNVPSNCDYNINLYSSNGTTLLKSSTNSGTSSELLTCQVTAGTTYYVRVYSASGSSTTSYYLFRAKVYPSKALAVPLYQQQEEDTCGSACGRMILAYYNISVTEEAFVDTAQRKAGPGDNYTYVYAIKDALNYYFSNAGTSTRYRHTDISSLSSTEYTNLILDDILGGHPVQTLLKFTNTTYFPYTSNGHYVVIKGMSYSSGSAAYNAVINDPYANSVYYIPISVIRSYNRAHSGYIIHIAS